MARPNKGQHKIPRTYLQAFADNNGLLWVIDNDLKLFSRKPKNLLIESDYYTIRFETGGGTLDIETKFLGSIEGSYATIYKEKLLKRHSLNNTDKARLAIFIASMMERQPMSRDSLKKFFSDIKEKTEHMRALSDEAKKRMAEAPIFHSGPSISATELLKMGEDIGSLHSSLIPSTVVDIAPIIFDMKWSFIVKPLDSEPFITSDNPVIMANPVAEGKYGPGTFGSSPGLAQKDVEITLPLSPDLAMVCGWKFSLDCEYVPVDSELVQSINRRTIRHAGVIISSDKGTLGQRVERIKEFRKQNLGK